MHDAAAARRLARLCAQPSRPVTSTEAADEILDLVRAIVHRCLDVAEAPCRGNAGDGVERARRYLEAHVAEPVSLTALAHVAYMHPHYLVRAFHARVGLPPHAYLVQLRVARAASLLAAGASLAYAAYAAGFADQSHLSRKFKEAYATTPRRFVREVEGAAVCARTTTGRAAEQGTVALRRAV